MLSIENMVHIQEEKEAVSKTMEVRKIVKAF
jgi:hypothetical protein